MRRTRPTLTLVPAVTVPQIAPASYRNEVVELPWRDRFGRIVLISIDSHGRIFDQSAATGETEAQYVADRMHAALNAAPILGLLS